MKKIFTIIICILFISLFIQNSIALDENNEKTQKIHLPIDIKENKDFTLKNGVTSGSGTENDPYIISNWNINNFLKNGISIKNTDAYFIIKNCVVSGIRYQNRPIGISLNNVSNGKIIDTTCKKTSWGFIISSTSNVIVDNCISIDASSAALTINGCSKQDTPPSFHNIIKNCYFSKSEVGVYFCCNHNSKDNKIIDCHIDNNNKGIVFDHLSSYITVVNCNISNNKKVGLEVNFTSSNNFFTNNIFYNNSEHAYDNCENIWDNGIFFGGNIWQNHDYTKPYIIPGAGNNIDRFPKKNQSDYCLISDFYYEPEILISSEKVFFNSSLSFDSNGNISNYFWSFGDGNFDFGAQVNHTYEKEGIYPVNLTITSGNKIDFITRYVEIFDKSNNTIFVNSDNSIQDAINTSNPGDKIMIANGTYFENIIIDKPYITLIGEDKGNTIIDGLQKDNVVSIFSSYVNISNFTIKNSSNEKAGIQIGICNYCLDSKYCNILNNMITKNHYGIYSLENNNQGFYNNVIYDNFIGIYLNKSHSNIISNNLIKESDKGFFIYYGSNWNKINKCIITKNIQSLYINWSHYSKINHNEIINNNEGIYLSNARSPNITYNRIYNNSKYGLFCENKISIGNFKNNYWGSIFGPSGIFKLFGDKALLKVNIGKYDILIGLRPICKSWLKS